MTRTRKDLFRTMGEDQLRIYINSGKSLCFHFDCMYNFMQMCKGERNMYILNVLNEYQMFSGKKALVAHKGLVIKKCVTEHRPPTYIPLSTSVGNTTKI